MDPASWIALIGAIVSAATSTGGAIAAGSGGAPARMPTLLNGGARGEQEQRRGPSPSMAALDGLLDVGMATASGLTKTPSTPTPRPPQPSPRQYAAQQSLMRPGGVDLGKPFSSFEPRGLTFAGQTPSPRGPRTSVPAFAPLTDEERLMRQMEHRLHDGERF